MREMYDRLQRVTDRIIGPHVSRETIELWHEDLPGFDPDTTTAWSWRGNEVFAKLLDDESLELLVVLTSLDETVDWGAVLEKIDAALPSTIETDIATSDDDASVVMIALTFDEYTDITDHELSDEVTELLDVAAQLLDQQAA